jgi:hypothetical protein
LIRFRGADEPCKSKAVEVQKGQLNEKAANELKPMCYLKESMTEADLIVKLYKDIYDKGEAVIYSQKKQLNRC